MPPLSQADVLLLRRRQRFRGDAASADPHDRGSRDCHLDSRPAVSGLAPPDRRRHRCRRRRPRQRISCDANASHPGTRDDRLSVELRIARPFRSTRCARSSTRRRRSARLARPGSEDADRIRTELLASLPPSHRSRVQVRAPDYSKATLSELAGCWGAPETVVSSRYHGALVAAWSGARVVVIERNAKLAGLVKQLGLTSVKDLRTPAPDRGSDRESPACRGRSPDGARVGGQRRRAPAGRGAEPRGLSRAASNQAASSAA